MQRLTGLTLRWVPRVAVLALALALGAVAGGEATQPPAGVAAGPAVALGLAQALPLVLALVTPAAAFWASLGAGMLVSEVLRAGGDGPVWAEPSLLGHLGVLALLGLRAPPVVLVAGWLLSLLAGAVLVQRMPGMDASADLDEMTLLSAVVLIAAGALGARTRAQRRLAESERTADEERARRTLLEERSRIARELHDVVAHHMSVVAIQAEAAPYRVTDPPPELVRALGTIRTSAVEALTELHRVLGLLRSPGPDEELRPQPGLDRLDELVGPVRETGCPVAVTLRGEPRPVPPGVGLSAYRIVQEALSNVLRHAPGAAVEVLVEHRPDGIELTVANGPATGPTVAAATGSGHGLLGMRERVAMLGGELAAGPDGRGGYAVRARLPVAPASEVASAEADR